MRALGLSIALLAVAPALPAEARDQSFGVWRNPSNSVHVRAEPCGARMCGVVVWASDKAKADAARGGTPQLIGARLFRDFRQEKPGVWRGRVFVPDINKTFSEVNPAEYDAVYCAGGRGPEYIRTDKRVQAFVKHFHDANKPIFTICHGVQILVAVDGVVRGKKVAALGACEPEVRLAGGTYIDVKPTEAYVDGTMVSAKGWTGLAAFMRECLKVLGTEIRHGETLKAAA